METVATYENGYLVRWCMWCGGFHPIRSEGTHDFCMGCGRELSLYERLKTLPRVKDEPD